MTTNRELLNIAFKNAVHINPDGLCLDFNTVKFIARTKNKCPIKLLDPHYTRPRSCLGMFKGQTVGCYECFESWLDADWLEGQEVSDSD